MRLPTVAALSGLMLCGAAPSRAQLSAVERQRVVAALWSEARYNYAYWDRVRADWDSAFVANLALAAPRQTDVQFYRRLRRFVALLSDGQADVTPPPAVRARIARPPIVLVSVERRPFIVDYAENDEMRVARPERLAEVLAVQGVAVETWIRDSVLPETPGSTPAARWDRAVARMLDGERGTALALQLRLPGGEARGASVTRTAALTARWSFERDALEVDSLPDGVVCVRITSLADQDVAREFDRAFPDFHHVTGLVLDLRGHAGSAAGRENAYRILARLADRPFMTSLRRMAQYRPTEREGAADPGGAWLTAPPDTVQPRRDRPGFAGPVAALASRRTAGAAEDLLVALRNAGRGPVVGDTTAGSTGQVLTVALALGWSLQLSVTRDAFPDGAEFGGLGLAPELPVGVRVPDFLAGRDPVLDRARQYVAQRRASAPH